MTNQDGDERAQGPPGARPTKTYSVQFRVDEEQRRALKRAARQAGGDTLGNWARRHLLQLAGYKFETDD